MGDKWTTSGRWRLQAKQGRTFAGRNKPTNTNKTGPSMTTVTAGNNPQINQTQTHPIPRKRNGGGKSFISFYDSTER
jgi:hypothetical protein